MMATMTRKRSTSTADYFREQIERAESEGLSRADLKLRLTHRDVNHLKRDTSLAVTDISFTGGVMRYLGVEVAEGGVVESQLERPGSGEA